MSNSSNETGSRMQRKDLYMAAATIGITLVVGVPFLVQLFGPMAAWLFPPGALLALVCGVGWFVSLDEVAQRAHYEAYFWGGSCGLLALGLGAGAVALFGGPQLLSSIDALVVRLWGEASAFNGVALGIIVAMLFSTIGYAFWWTGFWLRNR